MKENQFLSQAARADNSLGSGYFPTQAISLSRVTFNWLAFILALIFVS